MELEDRVVVITGGASGIGRSVARAFAGRGARVMIGDLSADAASTVAREIGGLAQACDVTREAEIEALVAETERALGPIDLFFSNAGLARGEPSHAASASNDVWQQNWEVHVMSHVYAARAVLPGMLARGQGYLLQMASAAGLLNQIGDAAYTATKHAAVAFAESLAITHGDDGIRVSVVCPQYVATPLTGYEEEETSPRAEGTITAEDAAQAILEGVEAERFLVHTHPDVAGYVQQRAADPERWISGMRRLRQGIIEQAGGTGPAAFRKLV